MVTMTDCHDNAQLVTYLYGECTDPERAAVEAHLAACPTCTAELEQIRLVRASLAAWSLPDHMPESVAPSVRQAIAQALLDPSGDVPGLADAPRSAGQSAPQSRPRGWTSAWWAQAAAAVLVLGAGIGMARIEVRYDADGFVVRTGWATSPDARPVDGAEPAADLAPWRAELAALEQDLRQQLAAGRAASAPAPGISESAVLGRVRAMIDQSEQRQQQELAERLRDVVLEVDTQRRADLRNVNQNFGLLEGRTGIAVRENQEMADWIRRVSQQR